MRRSHYCGDLKLEHQNQTVTLCGWVHKRRDHGGVLFIDLRDRTGIVQLTFDPANKAIFEQADALRNEYVIELNGKVLPRPQGTENSQLPTGQIEVHVESLTLLNTSAALPFEISDFSNVSEEVRLQYRYLDLRRSALQRNLITRHKMTQAMRQVLNQDGFLEIETPFLTKSTPEGARDFLVPSRLSPGNFYALPQSPQLFKQILMVGGLDKYYQIARCFRDEDLRSDRQPEFTQVDLEMSFVDEDDVIALTEKIIARAFEDALGRPCQTPFLRLSYQEAMNRFGSDKPDMRYGMELVELTEVLKDCGFQVFASAAKSGGVIKAICLTGGAKTSRSEIDQLTELAKKQGAKGLAWIKFTESGAESSIVKFFSSVDLENIQKVTGAKAGDMVLFGAGQWKEVCSVLGFLRVELNRRYDLIPKTSAPQYQFLWVVDFPMLEWDADEKRWNAMHHPFTSPQESDIAFLETDPGKVHARAYDVVLNGTELGGGSVRIHRKELQSQVFKTLGISKEDAETKFGFLLSALNFGAPPHAGIALGLDRMVAIFMGEDSIRDTIAFPKTQRGLCLMSGSPSEVSAKQLKEISIKTAVVSAPNLSKVEEKK